VALDSRQFPLSGPAAVAVHDNGDMQGNIIYDFLRHVSIKASRIYANTAHYADIRFMNQER
jgi:hypothetical protein